MKLSIVIVNWNTRKLLEQCLRSIYANAPQEAFEVIVVDNASMDVSATMVRQKFPQVSLIVSLENLGFAGGSNLGIRQCTGTYILLLNPDTLVRPDALQALVQFMDQHPEAGAAGARLINPDGSLQPSCSPTPTLSREIGRMFHLPGLRADGYYAMQAWEQTQPHLVEVIMGACLLLRREALDQVGLLSEDYFMYSEEVDLCNRLQKAGWLLFWVPSSQVVHYGGQSTRQVASEMFLHLYGGKVLYFRKHHGWPTVLGYKGVLFLATLARLALTPLALFEPSPKRDKHLSLSRNYRLLLTVLPRM